MSRVADIRKQLDECDDLVIKIDAQYQGKGIEGDDAIKFKDTLALIDKLNQELALETTRENATKEAAIRAHARADRTTVNIQHGDGKKGANLNPDKTPGNSPIPDAFTKAFGGFASVGDAFVNSKEWKEALEASGIKAGAPDTILSGVRINSRPALIDGVSYKALVTSATSSAGYLYRAQRLPSILELLREPIRVTDLFNTVPVTGTNAVEYVKETLFTNNATVVPEATSTTDDAALKPESELTFGLESDTLQTIAHLIPATRQILADAPQLRALIDNRLRIGLLEKLEANVVAAIYAASLLTQAKGGDTQLDCLYKLQQKVRVTGRAMPESYIMHPNDWGDIRLAKDVNGGYLMGPPSTVGFVTVWGLPVVETQNVTEGQPLCGDWSMFGALYEREQIQTYVTDSHADWFKRNLIAILMEMRALLAVYRDDAAGKATGF